jgi:hypothetical protein
MKQGDSTKIRVFVFVCVWGGGGASALLRVYARQKTHIPFMWIHVITEVFDRLS